MIITFYEPGTIKAQVGDRSLVFNPGDRQLYRQKSSRFSADLILVGWNNPQASINDQDLSTEQFLINGPGEYELLGITVNGFLSTGPNGENNTIYSVDFGNLRLVYLGALADDQLSTKANEEIGSTDILFTPIGGMNTLTPAKSAKLATNIQAKIIIPVFYEKQENLELFKKEMADDEAEIIEKLSIKKSDLEGRESEIIILSAN